MPRPFDRRLLALGLALMTGAAAGPRQLPADQAYVWQRSWTPALVQAVAGNSDVFGAWHVLVAEIGRDGAIASPDVNWPVLLAGGHKVAAVIRIEGTIAADPSLLRAQVARIVAHLPLPVRAAIEIDHDCATARLAGYTAFLRALRTALPGTAIAITALPTWLASPRFPALARAADLAILQVHSIGDPRGGVFDPGAAARGVAAMAAATAQPFLVALPAYGARIVEVGGRVLAVSAERPALDGTPGIESAASPAAVAAFRAQLQRTAPPGLRGTVWFRLPTGDDARAWSAATLRAVARGETPHPRLIARTRPEPSGGARTIMVANAGDADGVLPAAVALPPGCAAADGIGEYVLNGDRLRLRGGGGLLAPNQAVPAGWMRCAGVPHVAE